MTDMKGWLERRAKEKQPLYEQYGKALEKEHRDEYVAIAPSGETILGKRMGEVAQKAVDTFGSGNFQLQELIGRVSGDVDLSAYRFIRNDIWHVAVVGDRPPAQLRQEIEETLASGESIRLDKKTRRWLRHRRQQQSKRGSWVEGHYRPGRGFRFGR